MTAPPALMQAVNVMAALVRSNNDVGIGEDTEGLLDIILRAHECAGAKAQPSLRACK